MQVGDLVKYKRSSSYRSRKSEPLGLVIKSWKPRSYPDRANDWAEVYTDAQRELGEKIRKHVERPVEETK